MRLVRLRRFIVSAAEDFGPRNCWRAGHAWLPCLARDLRKVLS